MPIYAYRCEHCGFQKDVLQKMSDPPLVTCPSCGEAAMKKQVTAAGFQLKGSGWYVTDFRNPQAKEPSKGKADEAGSGESGKPAEGAAPESKPAAADSPAPPAAAPAPAVESKPAAPAKASPAPTGGDN